MHRSIWYFVSLAAIALIFAACSPGTNKLLFREIPGIASASTVTPAATAAAPVLTAKTLAPTPTRPPIPTATPAIPNTGPIKIGVSLPLSGDYAANGQSFLQGYQLWADMINQNGGLLGRKVELDILSDSSSTDQVATNVQKMITQDRVDLLFGPYSTPLFKSATAAANRFGYVVLGGTGSGPSAYNQGYNNTYDVSMPVANTMGSFAKYILSLPAGKRPTTVAYVTEDHPLAQPQVDQLKQILEKAGLKTVLYQVYASETTQTGYNPIADKIIASNAQVVVVGTQLPDLAAFVTRFRQQRYNPQMMVATGGADQVIDFPKAIGGAQNTEGIMVPVDWYAANKTPGNAEMVQAYLARYGGKPEAIPADVARAYSVGQVLQQVVTKIQSIDNAKIIAELQSGSTYATVQGPVLFDETGQNIAGEAYLFQWQKGALVPVYPEAASGAVQAVFPKPQWP